MINSIYRIINYGTIILVAGLALVMLFKLVPETWFVTLLYIAIGLLVIRIISRLYITNYNKKLNKGE
ncbi:MAG TPA: hypothetical protein VI362_03145 [Ignavibacteriaceae bacterium]|nr:hypothetical protein [Ignavibacteriaceae bacterium]